LNAADYGDPTSRERLFIQARRGKKRIIWPEATHEPKRSKPMTGMLFAPRPLKPYRPAREIIDWEIQGENIFNRKRPLALATMQRIAKGMEKFCGIPFVINSGGPEISPRSVDEPLNTVLTRDHLGIVQPFLIKYYGGQFAHSLDEPLPAITANYEHYGLCQPFIVGAGGPIGSGRPQSVDEPLGTVLTENHRGLVQPFIVELKGNMNARSLDAPLSTIATSGAHHGLCQPFLIQMDHGKSGIPPRSLERPMPTITSADAFGLVQPFIIPTNHGKGDTRSHSIDSPMPTVTSVDAWGLIEPFLIKYNGTGGPLSVEEPLDTVTAKDRFGLVDTQVRPSGATFFLDIRFRMLQPHELAAAMSFPKSYHFVGNREEKVKQIGNAVPVGLAMALCKTILS
jgi:DNA (cytosine-5)-methyltransferase 1